MTGIEPAVSRLQGECSPFRAASAKMVRDLGFEPRFCGNRPHVLPLDESRMVLSRGIEPRSPALQTGAMTTSANSGWSRSRESNPTLLLTKQLGLHGLIGTNWSLTKESNLDLSG